MRRTKYTREVLEPVVARSHSMSDVIRAFGLRPNGGNHRHFTSVVFKAGLDTSHFDGTSSATLRPIRSLTYDELAPIVASATSIAQVLAHLGLPIDGRPHRELTRRIRDLGLDGSHLRGAGWARGETKETHPAVARISRRMSLPDDEVFIEGSLITGRDSCRAC